MTIRSFDVFDTLFARRYVTSEIIWEEMERIHQIPDFSRNRKDADNGQRSLSQIYEAMQSSGVLPEYYNIEELVSEEIRREAKYIFPIKENIDQVRNSDILVSDMYMKSIDILNLVRSVGMDKQVSIYQSNGDKSNGSFWSRMRGKLDIEYHLGDNIHSDFNVPISHGFNAIHYAEVSKQTTYEKFLGDNGLRQLSLLLREIRLRNYDPLYSIYLETAGQQNLILLFVLCELLHRKYPSRPITFLGRDCELMYKIYNEFYSVKSYYLPFSREVAQKQTAESVEYLKTNTFEDSVLVDISSTGRTWEIICRQHPFDVEAIIYSDLCWYSDTKPVLPKTFDYIHQNSVIGQTSIVLEIFNCGTHGKLNHISVINGVPIGSYGTPELPKKVVDLIHKPVNDAVQLHRMGEYESLIEEFSSISSEDLELISAKLLVNISTLPIDQLNINNTMVEFDKKESEYLEYLK